MEQAQENASPAPVTEVFRHPSAYTINEALADLVAPDPTQVARHLLQALVHTTNAEFGHLILADTDTQVASSLTFRDGQIQELDYPTALQALRQTLAGWSYQHRQRVLVSDSDADPRSKSWQDLASFKSALAVPISTDTQLLGAIALFSLQPKHFDDAYLSQASAFCVFAAGMIENIYLHHLAAQNQKTINALGYAARFINTYPDLEQTLTRLLHQLTLVLSTPNAIVLLRQDEQLYPTVTEGFSATGDTAQSVFSATDIPIIFQILQQGRIVSAHHEDLSNELGKLGFSPPIQTWISAPLISRQHTLGIVILTSPTPKAFTNQEHLTLEAIANHIATAIAHHRLEQETNHRLRELAFLNETGQAITSTLNLERILRLLLDRVRELLRINAVSIALRDEQTGDLVFEAASGEGAAGVLGIRLKPGQGIAGWVAETGKPLVVPDVYQDARFFSDIDQKIGMRTRAILCVPIVLKGHVVGVIEALNPGMVPFDKHAVDLLTGLAGLAASAIDNARLFARVRSAEARYEGLFENSVNPIIITDLEGNIVDANRNACELLGRTKEALLGTHLTHIHSAEGTPDFVLPHRQIQAGEIATFQTNILRNSQRVKVEIRGQQVHVQNTIVIQWIGRDISAEAELEQMREDLVRMIIHDLRNPLANIMNSLDVLQDVLDEKDNSVPLDELLNIAKRSGQRLHQLINSILDISRLETGQAILDTRETDLAALFQEAITFIQPQADIREIQLTATFAPDLPRVEIDSDMISRVLLNLFDNAIKFTQVGGRVNLTVKPLGAQVEITVTDNGPGIPADQLGHIFEKFVRARHPHSPKGTGLGLAFCDLAVKAHGGRIWAESQIGQGTTIRVLLPSHSPNSF